MERFVLGGLTLLSSVLLAVALYVVPQYMNITETEVVRSPQVAAATTDRSEPTVQADVSVTPQVLPQSDSPLINEINATRRSNGRGPLSDNARLNNLAQMRADDMVARGYYSHTDPDGRTFDTYLPSISYACENLDIVTGSDISSAVASWMNSSSHKECMLQNRTAIVGVGYADMGEVNYGDQTLQTYVVVAIMSSL